ncbi:murein transglycosylase A [Desulfoplanes sp. PS50]
MAMNRQGFFALIIIGWTVMVMACSGCSKPRPSGQPPVVVIEELRLETTQESKEDLSLEKDSVPKEKEPLARYVPLTGDEKQQMLTRLAIKRQKIGSWEDLRPALSRSLAYLRTKPPQVLAIEDDNLTCTFGDLCDTVEKLIALLPELDEHPEYLKESFEWYRLEPSTLMTGYYEPRIHASPAPCPEYPFPVYGVPKDLKTADLGDFHYRWAGHKLVYRIEDGRIQPYHDRAAIDSSGVLADQGIEIAWVRDLVDLFFLQIQGSGRLVFPDGSVRHVLYAGKNGHKYVSLGRVLIERGYMNSQEMSMQGIRTFLKNHPGMVENLLNTNPSYVFFRLADDGPYGAMGATLTPLVSVASDPTRVPLGSVLLQQVSLPGDRHLPEMVLVGLAQDRGGAIKGDHLDLFCGAGEMAAFLAGHMKEKASVCILVSSGRLARK